MVFAEKFIASVTFHRKIIQLLAEGVTAMCAHVR